MKIRNIVLGILVAISATTVLAYTETIDGVTWNYYVNNGEAILGCGGMYPISSEYDGDLNIPSSLGGYPVRNIPDHAFSSSSYFSEVTSIVIPAGVTNIGASAFSGCNGMKLNSVTIPDGVKSIGRYAFAGCKFTTVSLPDSVVKLGDRAFYNCTHLNTLRLSSGLKVIEESTFHTCNLSVIEIPDSVTTIAKTAFAQNYMVDKITLGESVATIGEEAFRSCGYYYLTNVVFPSSVTSIGEGAFSSIAQYSSSGIVFEFLGDEPAVDTAFGYNLTSKTKVLVHKDAKWNCSIPGTWYSIAIDYKSDGTEAKSDGGPYTETIGDVAWTFFVADGKATVQSGEANSAAIPTSTSSAIIVPLTLGGRPVVAIGDAAFAGCESLVSITIPTNIASVGSNAFANGSDATSYRFEGSLPEGMGTSGISGQSVIRYNYIYEEEWQGCAQICGWANATTYPRDDGGPFYQTIDGIEWCYHIESGEAVISARDPNSAIVVPSIPESTTGVLSIPEKLGGAVVTKIDRCAFENCSALTELIIPESVRTIADDACKFCSGLISASIPSGVTNLGSSAFSYCSKLKNATIPDGMTSIPEYAFYECDALESVSIPSSVVEIGQAAFSECPSIANVKMPTSYEVQCIVSGRDSVTNAVLTFAGGTSVKDYSFYAFSKLVSVDIPEGVERIGQWSFYNCSSLTSVKLPQSLRWIDYEAFSGCSALESIVLPNGLAWIGESAFEDCSSLASLKVPDSVTNIGVKAFCRCSGLEEIWIPNSVAKIDGLAFALCNEDAVFYFDCKPPEGLSLASIPTACRIRYNPTYAKEWKAAIADCGFTNAKSTLDADGPYSTIIDGVQWNYKLYLGEVTLLPFSETVEVGGEIAVPAAIGVFPVTEIGAGAFRGASGVTGVTMPSSVVRIADGAFERCTAISSVKLPQGLLEIGDSAFERCASLETVTIPASVTNIGYFAFRDCLRLAEMKFEGNMPHKELAACMGTPLFTVLSTRSGSVTASIETAIVVDGDVTVPNKWLDEIATRHEVPAGYDSYEAAFVAKFGSDLKSALTNETGKIDWQGHRLHVWQDYVAGTDPLDEEDTFRATVTMEDGVPVVRWSPTLSDAQAQYRQYTVYGATALNSGWVDVTSLSDAERHDSGYQFFKVTVKLK